MEVYIPILEIHNDEANFIRPSEFIPERFSRENKNKIPKGSYLPFGDGPRKCIGNFTLHISRFMTRDTR